MSKISNAMTSAASQTQVQLGSSKMQRMVRFLGVIILVALFTMTSAFASTSQAIQTGVKSGTQQLYNIMTAIVLPVAAVCFAWNAFKALFGGEKGLEQAKKNMLTIVIILALVYLAPFIVEQIGGWFNNSTSTTIFS